MWTLFTWFVTFWTHLFQITICFHTRWTCKLWKPKLIWEISWRCSLNRQKCMAKIRTDADSTRILSGTLDHNRVYIFWSAPMYTFSPPHCIVFCRSILYKSAPTLNAEKNNTKTRRKWKNKSKIYRLILKHNFVNLKKKWKHFNDRNRTKDPTSLMC